MAGIACLQPRKTPSALTAWMRRHCSSVVSSMFATSDDARVVHQHVELAETRLGVGDQAHPARLVAHVVTGEERGAAELLRERLAAARGRRRPPPPRRPPPRAAAPSPRRSPTRPPVTIATLPSTRPAIALLLARAPSGGAAATAASTSPSTRSRFSPSTLRTTSGEWPRSSRPARQRRQLGSRPPGRAACWGRRPSPRRCRRGPGPPPRSAWSKWSSSTESGRCGTRSRGAARASRACARRVVGVLRAQLAPAAARAARRPGAAARPARRRCSPSRS